MAQIKRLSVFIVLFISGLAFAQSDDTPAVWNHEVKKISDTEYELIFSADIYKDWYIYSQYNAEGY